MTDSKGLPVRVFIEKAATEVRGWGGVATGAYVARHAADELYRGCDLRAAIAAGAARAEAAGLKLQIIPGRFEDLIIGSGDGPPYEVEYARRSDGDRARPLHGLDDLINGVTEPLEPLTVVFNNSYLVFPQDLHPEGQVTTEERVRGDAIKPDVWREDLGPVILRGRNGQLYMLDVEFTLYPLDALQEAHEDLVGEKCSLCGEILIYKDADMRANYNGKRLDHLEGHHVAAAAIEDSRLHFEDL